MIDITHKSNTLRYACAEALVEVSMENTIMAVEKGTVPKGNVLESARVAALFGIKKTAELIPDCHPLPIEQASVSFEIEKLSIRIKVEVKTIYKTGVEVEAMHGASIAALTIYDMLKPIDKGISIQNIRLLEKKGGKSSYKEEFREEINAGIIVCSDTVSKGLKEDKAGLLIKERLLKHGINKLDYHIVPDEKDEIVNLINELVSKKTKLILTTGGTGLSIRDNTPDAIAPLIEKNIPGIAEMLRDYGQNRMPYAMLSRSIAGTIGESLIITLPGSTNGAKESMDALMPQILHVFKIFKGGQHN